MVYDSTMIIRAVRRGETFDYGNMEAVPDLKVTENFRMLSLHYFL